MLTLCLHTCTVRNDGLFRVGKMYMFAVLGYREDGIAIEEGRTLFVQVRPFDAAGVLGQDSCGGYTFRTSALKSVREKVWVHASKLCTYMYKPKGSEKSIAERALTTKIIPVAKAFVRD
jgi:hypothetical protein